MNEQYTFRIDTTVTVTAANQAAAAEFARYLADSIAYYFGEGDDPRDMLDEADVDSYTWSIMAEDGFATNGARSKAQRYGTHDIINPDPDIWEV